MANGGRATGVALIAASALVFTASTVSAQSLRQSLITSYQSSPTLETTRAQLRAIDENVGIARSSRRPSVSASTSGSLDSTSASNFDVSRTISAGLNASLLVYDHGATAAAIESAKAGVAAQRAVLENVEQQVLADTVGVFMDIRRDIAFVQVGENNVSRLRQQVQASNDRFELGEVTRTDVSLADSRLAAARSDLAAFRGNLQVSRERYRAIVGVPADSPLAPPPVPSIPASQAQAEAIAMKENPLLRAARFNQTAAEFDLRRARSARGPSVSVTGSSSISNTDATLTGSVNETLGVSVGVTGSLPIYQGGQLSALVRQAEAVLAQSKFDVQATARDVRQGVAIAWSNLEVSRALTIANRAQVDAAQISLDGAREEATLGARTTLDVLDREQELRDAEVRLVSSQRDEYVQVYELLQAMGLLSVSYLGLGIPEYDPDVNYNRVQNAPYSTVEGSIVDKLRDRYSR